MYLTNLHIKNLKLLRDFELSFCNPDGTPRMWTVIIGDNGTGKTSILQAIAMAAAGGLNVNDLVRDNVASLLDKRHSDESMTVEARFLLNKEHASKREYPLLHPEHDEPNGGLRLPGDLQVWADVKLDPGSSNLVATFQVRFGNPHHGRSDCRSAEPESSALVCRGGLWNQPFPALVIPSSVRPWHDPALIGCSLCFDRWNCWRPPGPMSCRSAKRGHSPRH